MKIFIRQFGIIGRQEALWIFMSMTRNFTQLMRSTGVKIIMKQLQATNMLIWIGEHNGEIFASEKLISIHVHNEKILSH